MKMLKLPSSKRAVARQASNAATISAPRGLPIKPFTVPACTSAVQLTLVKPDTAPEFAASGSAVGASASVLVVGVEENASHLVPGVLSEVGEMARLTPQESGAPVPQVATAISGQAAMALSAVATQTEPAADLDIVESDALSAEAPIASEANAPVYRMSDLVVEVKQLRLAIESAMAAFALATRSRATNRRRAQPVDPVLLEGLAGKNMLDIRAVELLVGAKRSTIYGWIKDGKFVKPVQFSAKASRWVAGEVEAWLNARIADRDQAAGETKTN